MRNPIKNGITSVTLSISFLVMFAAAVPVWSKGPPSTQDFSYQPESRRDPFKPPQKHAHSPSEPGENLSQCAIRKLTTQPLDSLKLVAILEVAEKTSPIALFQDPVGKGHIIQTGQCIGSGNALVTKMKKDEVVLSLPSPAWRSGRSSRTFTLKLHNLGPDPIGIYRQSGMILVD